MGLFKALGRKIGRAVEWVGEKTGIWAIESAGMKIQNACQETSRRTGASKEFDQATATLDQTAHMAEILSGFSIGLQAHGTHIEQGARKYIEEYFDNLNSAIDEIFHSRKLHKSLMLQKQLILSSIDGSFNEVLIRRVSLSDTECLNILKLPKGPDKEKKMDAFGNKVINEGLEQLCQKVKNSIESIRNETGDELSDIVHEKQNFLEDIAHQIEEVTKKRKSDADDKESSILLPSQKLAASELLLNLVQGGTHT